MWFLLERFPLSLGALDGLRYFIVALFEPSTDIIISLVLVLVSVQSSLFMCLDNILLG